MTAAQVRAAIVAAIGKHVQYNTCYSSWNDAKDLPTEREARFVIWDQWTARLYERPVDGALFSQQLVRLVFYSPAASDRPASERDTLVEDAHRAAVDLVLYLRTYHKDDFTLENVAITTRFDEGTQMDTGVVLQFTARSEDALCLDQSRFTD